MFRGSFSKLFSVKLDTYRMTTADSGVIDQKNFSTMVLKQQLGYIYCSSKGWVDGHLDERICKVIGSLNILLEMN